MTCPTIRSWASFMAVGMRPRTFTKSGLTSSIGVRRKLWSVTTFQAGHYPSVRVTHLSQACYHCGQPPCVAVCPQGALQKRAADGVVVLAADQCGGCQACVVACPYGAIATDPISGRSSKCDFCVALLDTGEPPVCVSACPVHVLDVGWLDAMAGEPLQAPGLPDPDVLRPAVRMRRHRHHGSLDRGSGGPED